jgi:hypothetical protein
MTRGRIVKLTAETSNRKAGGPEEHVPVRVVRRVRGIERDGYHGGVPGKGYLGERR